MMRNPDMGGAENSFEDKSTLVISLILVLILGLSRGAGAVNNCSACDN